MHSISSREIGSIPVEELVATASEVPIPDEAEVARMAGRFGQGHDDDVRAKLVRAHLRIAVDEAIRNRGLGQRQDVLVRVAAEAMLDAARTYDPSADGPFAQYARTVVRRAIRHAMVV